MIADHSRGRPVLRAAVSLCAVLALAACSAIGPAALRSSRVSYNIAIQQTNDEQLLLNLVRLKYSDTPLFLEVNNVTSQFAFGGSVSGEGEFRLGAGDIYTIEGGVDYEERPTVSYAPLQGNDFVQRLLAPISVDTIELLYHSGWNIDRLLRLTVQRINGIPNAPTASRPAPATAPDYAAFTELASRLARLEAQGLIELAYEARNGGNGAAAEVRIPVLQIAPGADAHPEIVALRDRLGLAEGYDAYPLLLGPGRLRRDAIRIETRSLLGVMSYLSKAVEVPELHLARGLVGVTRSGSGTPFDWKEILGDLIEIRVVEDRARDMWAAVAVPYRDHWFYIDDRNAAAKATFSLLSQLFSLQGGDTPGGGLTLTLPVGG